MKQTKKTKKNNLESEIFAFIQQNLKATVDLALQEIFKERK